MNNMQKIQLLEKHFAGQTEIEETDRMIIDGVLNQLGLKYIKLAAEQNIKFISDIAKKKLANEY